MQTAWFAFALACCKAGRSIAARMAIMAMTTSNSISVNARTCREWRFTNRRDSGKRANFAKNLAVTSLALRIFRRVAIKLDRMHAPYETPASGKAG